MKSLSIKPILRGLIATSLAISHTWAMDEIPSPFENNDLKPMIVSVAAVEQVLIDNPLTDLAWVNKEWLQIVKAAASHVNGPLAKALQGVRDENDDATYQAILGAKLVYRPAPASDGVELKISDFLNPFKGTFDLSKCREEAQDLTITTDPSVFFQVNQAHPTCHILIAPYFLIKKYITSTTKPFEKILKDWDKDKAPVGLFWRWSIYENVALYDYLLTSSLSHISSRNLYENWDASVGGTSAIGHWAKFLRFTCEPK